VEQQLFDGFSNYIPMCIRLFRLNLTFLTLMKISAMELISTSKLLKVQQ